MTIDETRELLATLADLYQNARFSPTADATWHRILAPYPATLVMAMVDQHGRAGGTFAPNAYEIVALMESTMSTEQPIDVVWSEVMRIVQSIGNPDHRTRGLREIAEVDPLAAGVIDTGITWYTLASTPLDRNDGMFRRFRDGLTAARAERQKAETREQMTAIGTAMPALNGAANGR